MPNEMICEDGRIVTIWTHKELEKEQNKNTEDAHKLCSIYFSFCTLLFILFNNSQLILFCFVITIITFLFLVGVYITDKIIEKVVK